MRRNLRVLGTITAGWMTIAVFVLSAYSQRGPVPAAPAQPAAAAPAQGRGQRGQGLPGTESGWSAFQTRCSICHLNPAVDRATPAAVIREMTPERIYDSLMTGSMKDQSQGLSDVQKRRIAEFLAGRPLGSSKAGNAKDMPNKCVRNPALTDPAASPAWNGWGNDNGNTRFQSGASARLTASDVPRLKLKWAFGFPTGETSNSQPTVVAGRVFAGSDNGFIYSLDAATGCVYWSFEGGSIVRGSLTVGPVSGPGMRDMPCSTATVTRTSLPLMRKTEKCSGKPKWIRTLSRESLRGCAISTAKFLCRCLHPKSSAAAPQITRAARLVEVWWRSMQITARSYGRRGSFPVISSPRRSSRMALCFMRRAAEACGAHRRSIRPAMPYISAPATRRRLPLPRLPTA